MTNKKMSILILLPVLLLLMPPAVSAARGPQGVEYTPHNLSANTAFFMYTHGNEDEICIFCHTPHSGSQAAQLWNRVNPTTTYTNYSSANLTAAGFPANRPVSNESLVCLSCHDGSVAVNQILNISNRTGSKPIGSIFPDITVNVLSFGTANDPNDPAILAAKIGASLAADGTAVDVSTDLQDDHPVSFSYTAVQTLNAAELKDVTLAETAGARFFGVDKRVECSSCHDPHVNYIDSGLPGDTNFNVAYTPFLVTPNGGSALCFACHTK